MKTVCLLGASGSIGSQTLDVMKKNPTDFSLLAFSVGHRITKISSILKYFPTVKHICVQEEDDLIKLKKKYPNIHFYYGNEGLNQIIVKSKAQIVVNALVGFVGLKPTLCALENNNIVCLANKEALVVGGELVNDLLSKGKGKLYPIDSEHVALAKCLAVESNNVNKLIITASGGAFRHLNREQLANATPEQALNHPTWKMGAKITIDCASMVNKTFEVIEAHYLFNYPIEKISILLNFSSYVHSIVEYNDGTYRFECCKPDMRKPIKYALYLGLTPFDTRTSSSLDDLKDIKFNKFDINRYPIVRYAEKVIKDKGTYGAVLNASNEEAVYAFLNHQIPFLAIEEIISSLMDEHINVIHPTYEQIFQADCLTRNKAQELIKKWSVKC